MLELAVILLRLVQFTGAMILFGSSLFLIYALPRQGVGSGAELGWSRRLLGSSAGGLLAASVLGLVAQTSILAGSISEGIKLSSLWAVITTMSMGPSTLIRAAAAIVALVTITVLRPGRTVFWVCASMGAVVSASFAWMGHGAATEGPGGLLHLIADILHVLAAGVWIGALAVFLGLLRRRSDDATLQAVLHKALQGFAGVGSVLVAILVVTGLVNSWFLVGPSRVEDLIRTPYGLLLLAKVGLLGVMLAFAAINRFQLTPRLGGALGTGTPASGAVAALRRSVALENGAALLVLVLVSVLGTLAPISAQ